MEIAIDMGTVFTAAVANYKSGLEWVKVETTVENPEKGFISCLDELARKMSLPLGEMLAQAKLIRCSSTIENSLLSKKEDSSLGLLVSKGFEKTLYYSSVNGKQDLPEFLDEIITSDMIVGIEGEVDDSGRMINEVNEDEVKKAVGYFVDSGATGVVVSLRNSVLNPSQEQKVREIIDNEYPAYYLGNMASFLASEVAMIPGNDYLRTKTAILNAYIRQGIRDYLVKAEEAARNAGYKRPFLLAHSTGGVATLARTTAINVCNSSPVAGLIGCAALAKSLYGIKDFVYMDVGGSRAYSGFICNGNALTIKKPFIDDIPIIGSMIKVTSIRGGSNAIAGVETNGDSVTVGPSVVSTRPGPAAYNLGGTEPTVLDADLVLGYLNPESFLGGRRLDRKKSAAAIEKIAIKTGKSVEEAAYAIVQAAERNIAEAMNKEIRRTDISAENLSLFAVGGGGGSRCCGCASRLRIPRIILFHFNAVASAVGCSMIDPMHIYECPANITLTSKNGDYLPRSEYNTLKEMVNELKNRALKDIQEEESKLEDISFTLTLETSDAGSRDTVEYQFPNRNGEIKIDEICRSCLACIPASGEGSGEIKIETITLRARCSFPHPEFPIHEQESEDASRALKEVRQVYWGRGFLPTHVYHQHLLVCGNRLLGPAIVEAPETTYLIPPGWEYTVDLWLNGRIEVQR